jgi:hypothetical protein
MDSPLDVQSISEGARRRTTACPTWLRQKHGHLSNPSLSLFSYHQLLTKGYTSTGISMSTAKSTSSLGCQQSPASTKDEPELAGDGDNNKLHPRPPTFGSSIESTGDGDGDDKDDDNVRFPNRLCTITSARASASAILHQTASVTGFQSDSATTTRTQNQTPDRERRVTKSRRHHSLLRTVLSNTTCSTPHQSPSPTSLILSPNLASPSQISNLWISLE